MKSKFIKVMSVLLAATMVFAGCKNDGSSQSDAEKPSDQQASGSQADEKLLTIGTQYTVATLNPLKSTADGDRYILSNIYESLVEYDSAGKFVPGFAKTWENEDDNTWVFHLKEDSYWHTGNELFKEEKVKLTAKDVKDVFDFVADEKNESTKRSSLDNIASIEVVDDSTIKFVTKTPDAYFLSTLANIYLFPVKAFESDYDLTKSPVGSGPYKFESYETDDKVVLVKNDDFAIAPGLDKVIFKIIPDKSVLAIALANNEIDIATTIMPNDISKVVEKENLKVVSNPSGWYRYIGFNEEFELFKDPEMRKAISMAIDIDSAIKAVFNNDAGIEIAKRAYGPVPLEFVGANEEAWKKAIVPYDPEGAKKIIESKGYTMGANGFYEKDGKELGFTLKTANYDPNMKFGIIASTSLKQIGVNCVSQPMEWATFLSDLKSGNKEAFIMGGGSGLTGLYSLFHSEMSKGGSHCVNYVNPECDKLIEQAYATLDEEKRAELITEATVMTIKDNVHLGAFFEYAQWGMNTRVLDFEQVPALYFSLTNSQRNVTVK